jgi:hypothetical protein
MGWKSHWKKKVERECFRKSRISLRHYLNVKISLMVNGLGLFWSPSHSGCSLGNFPEVEVPHSGKTEILNSFYISVIRINHLPSHTETYAKKS